MKKKRIGIPRALLYYSYAHTWKAFFRELGYETITSPETSAGILNDGIRKSIGDLCLPVKTYLGHIKSLRDSVDYLFIPRYVSVEQNAYMCPKIIGLPDMVRACFSHLPEIISPMLNVKTDGDGAGPLFSKAIAKTLDLSPRVAEKAVVKALELPVPPQQFLYAGNTAPLPGNRPVRIGVIGRNYLVFDRFLVKNLFQTLLELGVEPVYVLPPGEEIREAMTVIPKWVYWSMGREVVTSAHMFFKDRSVDGIINVCSAACGPDSFTGDLIRKRLNTRNKPFMSLSLDEHASDAGILTRIEAFVDMLRRETA